MDTTSADHGLNWTMTEGGTVWHLYHFENPTKALCGADVTAPSLGSVNAPDCQDCIEAAKPRPTKAGQPVKSNTGKIGITTEAPRKRSPQIGVQFAGDPYPVLMQLSEVECISIEQSA